MLILLSRFLLPPLNFCVPQALQTFNCLRKIGAKHQVWTLDLAETCLYRLQRSLNLWLPLPPLDMFAQFSAGLVVGGTSVDDEQAVITSTNIIICTPGRLLHHMDETPAFNCDNLKVSPFDTFAFFCIWCFHGHLTNRRLRGHWVCALQILVLDEADRILDLGFSATLNAIIENLPTERQTLVRGWAQKFCLLAMDM